MVDYRNRSSQCGADHGLCRSAAPPNHTLCRSPLPACYGNNPYMVYPRRAGVKKSQRRFQSTNKYIGTQHRLSRPCDVRTCSSCRTFSASARLCFAAPLGGPADAGMGCASCTCVALLRLLPAVACDAACVLGAGDVRGATIGRHTTCSVTFCSLRLVHRPWRNSSSTSFACAVERDKKQGLVWWAVCVLQQRSMDVANMLMTSDKQSMRWGATSSGQPSSRFPIRRMVWKRSMGAAKPRMRRFLTG
eukprot:366239-Chlamydomonas_euryale.AAC.34